MGNNSWGHKDILGSSGDLPVVWNQANTSSQQKFRIQNVEFTIERVAINHYVNRKNSHFHSITVNKIIEI